LLTAQWVGFYLSIALRVYPAQVYPVLFRFGSLLIPSYGALAALGVLSGLLLVQRTARVVGVSAQQMWNLSVFSLFVALAGSRVLLIAVNWSLVRMHPGWLLGLAMVHHPLLAALGAAFALTAAALYARWQRMAWDAVADAAAPALAMGFAFEQIGALLSGASFGTETSVPWAVTYTDPFAERWSGAPIGVPLHPVQAYCALAYFTIAILLLLWLPHRRQRGEAAGIWLVATGAAIFFTEMWRDRDGRGEVFGGILDGPQVAAILFVLLGALLLRKRASAAIVTVADGLERGHA
jgi:phosphatidylglycerol---prolipoprotein diacylglyceryl transferase